MQRSRIILFAARWAIMSGLAGTVFAALVFINRRNSPEPPADSGLLLAAALLLSVAFILAPFVRNAFVGPRSVKTTREIRKTLLDEMRDRVEDSGQAAIPSDPPSEPAQSPPHASRLIVALYVLFGCVLVAVLWGMG
jgi:hypothetical protein